MTKRRWMGVIAAIVILTVVIAAFALGCGSGEGEADSWSLVSEPDKEGVSSGEDLSLREESADSAYAGPGSGESGVEVSALPQLQLMVIKTALVEMEAGRGEYAKIREDAAAISSAAGGYVQDESASRDDEGLTYATLTLRVPADKFDEVLSEVSSLGDVKATRVSTEDVSAEYVDLESRLRHLQAEEEFYLSLIGKAQTIQEMITIREHLDGIQLEKEQVQGRMNFLDQQVGFSTLTLSLDEVAPDEDSEGFWNSVGDAFKSFGRGLKRLALGFFYALPYLLILLVIAVAVWLLVRKLHRKGEQNEAG
jgi:uncharacterized protein (DUF2132 family)